MNDQPALRPVTPLGLAAQELRELARLAAKDTDRSEDFGERLRRVAALVGGLDPYVEQMTSPASPALEAIDRRTAQEPWPQRFSSGNSQVALEAEMLSGHVEGQFLRMLVSATRARRILEIGLFTGYSALAMAEALPEDGVLVALELDSFAADFARRGFDHAAGRKIEVRVGPASQSLREMADKTPFDLIFIDADKSGYIGYLDIILKLDLLSPGGLICVDNTLMQGQAYLPHTASDNGRAIAAFNRRVADDPSLRQVLVPMRDGVTLIQRA
ncbi:class I SAM-dependent methyltransferase [Croceicoccus sp. F390]|uniref:Class I SAM-dependent methyltransferase n=1 Tax=Croceicoccus esteveae TaxID=3075597 RepID=A0ABU2ZH23_9SPHN|nr:class I SAM-dependent methyltransferase [Croceicoccus sp. F390]MDT0575904.1 class I SAM-dependent methyltransferase [Croceicoccus sp. F390]